MLFFSRLICIILSLPPSLALEQLSGFAQSRSDYSSPLFHALFIAKSKNLPQPLLAEERSTKLTADHPTVHRNIKYART